MIITTVGIDLAKSVFHVCAVDKRGVVVERLKKSSAQLTEWMANLQPCLVGLEACGGAHHWARTFQKMGHTVKIMSPQFVAPYVKTNKNDHADAAAICEAVTRPSMRFVPIKSIEQQDIQALHRARQLLVKDRTALCNQCRGTLLEYGVTIAKGVYKIAPTLTKLLESETITAIQRELITDWLERLQYVQERIDKCEEQLEKIHRNSEASKRLATIPGIGPLTATALIAAIGDGRDFKNGRHLSAWLGLVPRQHSTGGKPRLLGISKRGDAYLRTLFAHGARAVLRHAHRDGTQSSKRAKRFLGARHPNVAVIALANRNARTAWAVLTKKQDYREVA